MQDRSIKVGGSFRGIANTGDSSIINNSLADQDVTEIFADVLTQLAQRYPNAPEEYKQNVFQMELQQKMLEEPNLRQRFFNATKAGGFELVKVLTNNPFVSVPLETVKGWLETQSS